MNQEQTDKLANMGIETLKNLQDWLKDAGHFAQEQTPLLAQEIIRWSIASSAIWASLGLIIILAALAFIKLRKGASSWNCSESDREAGIAFCWVLQIGFSFIGLVVFLFNFSDILKAWIAPRLFLLEFVKNLVK